MPTGKKWSNANATINQASNVSKSAGLGTFDVAKVTDLRVSSIQGTHYSESAANVKGTSYGSGDFAGLTISAETIRYEGGGKLSDYIDVAIDSEIEQYIQPLTFYNDFDGSGEAPHGVIAHALQKDASDANDPNLKISAFGMFGAPGENLVLTVTESDGGIFNYINGEATAQLATGKTAITVDASNRVFMGVKGQDLKPGGLNYLIKGSPNAQLYVNGDIVVDGSGVQIDKYLVDDIFVGSSAAIMGAGLSGGHYSFYNDISNSVQDLSDLLSATEQTTHNAGYLFVANNSSFFGNVGISGGATLGDGLTLDNSGYWIDGHSTLTISTPSYGSNASASGISYKSINSNIFDYETDISISTFQHAIYDGKDSALLLHHSNPNTSQGSLIFLRTKGSSGATSDTDVTGEIQFRGINVDGSQNPTGYLKSTGAGTVTLYAPNDIIIDGSSSLILKTNGDMLLYSASTEINRVDGSGPVLEINDFTPITSGFNNTTQSSVAKLSLQRSNGVDPSTNKTGIIGEIDFNGYANGGTNINMRTAASIQCWNAGDSQASQASQGQNGFLAINIYDNVGNPGGDNNSAIQIDSTNHVYINGLPAAIGIQNSDRAWLQNPWDGASSNGFDTFPDNTYSSLNPAFSVFSSTTNGSTINNGLVAAAGGYITGTYIPDDAADYYMADVSYVNTHTNWKKAGTTLSPTDPSVNVVEAPSFNATSDVAKKENIQTISGALESINELRGVSYNLKTDKTKKTHHGVVAQEIEKIFPDMVAGEEGSKSVAYMEIIGVLIEAVKDLKKRVEELENK